MSGYRICRGALIDRNAPVGFRFDGVNYRGFAGDTLASALLATGIKLVGRSFKYHRPRGIFSAGPEEPNALVELGTGARREPNTRATGIELFDGLVAQSQNRFPTLSFDLMAVTSLLAPLFPAGFYYKTFMWPASFWERVYEPAIRRAAGLGRASGLPDPDTYGKSHAFCDLLVVGSGPAGLMAALAGARAGARVILCEQDFVLGGRLNCERFDIQEMPARQWVRSIEAQLRAHPNVRLLPRTCVFAAYDGNTYAAVERPGAQMRSAARLRLWKLVTRQAVVATGAIERPIAFGGNDKPGVMLASAVRSYLHRFDVVPGKRFVVFTTTDDGWKTAADLSGAGADVAALVEARDHVAADVSDPVARLGLRVELGAHVTEVRGRHAVRRVGIQLSSGASIFIEADTVAVSGGWNPALGLTSHLGSRPVWSEEIAAFVPSGLAPGMRVAGSVNGAFALSACLAAGASAGAAAAGAVGYVSSGLAVPVVEGEHVGLKPLWRSRNTRGKVFVDLQNDVTDADIELASREGLACLEHMKRYTTHGMATDQGKTSGIIGHALFATASGQMLQSMGVPKARPPDSPVAIGALAGVHRGRHFRPSRRTPSHRWGQEHAAVFVEAGDWLRAQWFARDGEDSWLVSVSREAAAVRGGVGVCDVSTLGKIDIQGPDAGTFLDRVYINTFSTLPVGRARYGVMLREDGFVFDDGTTSRLAEQHYYMTTTTANAAKVMQHLQFCLQVLWPDLDVQLASMTEQWAQYAIAGPRARAVLAKLVDTPFDIGNESFPFLAAATLSICGGCPARLFRISFSGELAYELAVPARWGEATWRAIIAAGEEFGLTPYGTEALSVLRIEKGHVAGNEINGRTTAADLGLDRMMSRKKDYIGRVLAGRPALTDPGRPMLVGLKPVGPQRLHAGAHLFQAEANPTPQNDQGWLSSVAFSPAVGGWIGLGFLKGGLRRVGERLRCWDPVRNGDVLAEVCHPTFVDPEGGRLRA